MPYRKVSLGHGRVRVVNARTGKVYAKKTTVAKANAQIRAMHANERK